MKIMDERHGELIANFSNGDIQKFTLEGMLLRPKLVLLTEVPSKNDFAMDEMNFGVCNVDCFKTIRLYLSNITEVTAKWSLNYVKFPKKTNISKYTTTQWEEENNKKIDDPDVFEFSLSTVSTTSSKLIFSRVISKERACPSDSFQKVFASLQFPRTNSNVPFFPNYFWSTSDLSRTCSTSQNSGSWLRTALLVT
jgi:hypothetical protein